MGKPPPADIEEPTPREIVEELDRFVIGQTAAKRAVAVALRNRARRVHIDPDLADEIVPKNIIMIGPTGVGKTEIARRLARLSRSPFVKVEASKFTEVGYVGRDVDSMVRDLVEVAVEILREEMIEEVREQVELNAEERLLDLLLPQATPTTGALEPDDRSLDEIDAASADAEELVRDPNRETEEAQRARRSREKLRGQLRHGELADRSVEVEIRESAMSFLEGLSGQGDDSDPNAAEVVRSMFGPRHHKTEMFVPQALDYFVQEEEERLVDRRQLSRLALERAEDQGIIFIDELDKVASASDSAVPNISRDGVQRDLLPLLDGSSVTTRYGSLRTDHILYIAAGAFQENRPSDLIPELQGRFPIRVELDALSVEDFERILTEPECALLKQYEALLATEGLAISFKTDGIREIAEVAAQMNERMEDIGARRLHTILEKVLEDLLFDAPELDQTDWLIDQAYVNRMLEGIVEDEDLSRFIV